jgi:hypothetical protein
MQPQDLYRAVQRGQDAWQFLLEMNRNRTGELKNTEGIDMRKITFMKRIVTEQEIEKEKQQSGALDLPTMLMSSVPVAPRDLVTQEVIAQVLDPEVRVKREALPPPLSIDGEGRVCLRLIDVGVRTIDLVQEGIQQFYFLTGGEYPAEIIPCPSRSLGLKAEQVVMLNDGTVIPYVRDFNLRVGYDIVLRGKP